MFTKKKHGKKKEQQAATRNKLNLILEMWAPVACNILERS
jgi:hypothetical protein